MQGFLERLQQVFDAARILRWLAELIPSVILALLVFAAFYLLYRLLSAVIATVASRVGLEVLLRASCSSR